MRFELKVHLFCNIYCVCVVCAHSTVMHVGRSEGDCRNQYSPSITWVPQIEPRTLTQQAILRHKVGTVYQALLPSDSPLPRLTGAGK